MDHQRLRAMWGLNYGWVPTADEITVIDMFENEAGVLALLIFNRIGQSEEGPVLIAFHKESCKFVFEMEYNEDNEYRAAEDLENLAQIAGMKRN